ncbi:hypothetical protein EDC04DRAFT_3090981 [Pisolithus marmoratus]|nr:hypothetical protein EDC04DRAFT_3090981 [Pisolithus marmoratus]
MNMKMPLLMKMSGQHHWPVAPVSQAEGSHESDEDTPHQKDVSDGSLTIWPDSTIYLEILLMHKTPSPSNQRVPVQPGSMVVTEGNAKALLEEGFEHINDEFNTLSGCVKMPIQQVIQCFTQQYACSNSANEWNAYQQYFAAHKAWELQRLPGGGDITGMPYTYKQILAMYKDTVVLGNADKTVAQLTHAIGAFLLAGSVINQDSGIGYMHTTPSAENFLLEWCHADEDEMLGNGCGCANVVGETFVALGPGFPLMVFMSSGVQWL